MGTNRGLLALLPDASDKNDPALKIGIYWWLGKRHCDYQVVDGIDVVPVKSLNSSQRSVIDFSVRMSLVCPRASNLLQQWENLIGR